MYDLLALALAYLIGSIPFGLLLTRAAGMGDIRAIGSGNIGATNVLRTGNKKLAAATLALDMAKGVIAVMVAGAVAEGSFFSGFAPFAAVAGHVFPVWLKFKGGKGVATAFGACLAFNVLVGFVGVLVWLLVFLYKRISSLSALVAISVIPVVALLTDGLLAACYLAPVAALVIYRHRENIARLKAGTEPAS